MTRPDIVAHRGGASKYPENSLAAFRWAASLGIEQAECDVHLTREGEVLVLHDPLLEQTTSGQGAAFDLTPDRRLETLVRGGDEAVPTLADLMDLLAPGSLQLRIEIKHDAEERLYPGIEAAVMDVVEGAGMRGRVVIIGFAMESLVPFARAGYRTGLCCSGIRRDRAGLSELIARVKGEGVGDLGINAYEVDISLIEQANAEGLSVGVWTANGPARLNHWLRMPVSYVTTDQPELALDIRESIQRSAA